MESLVARAAKLGIDSEYFDAHGKRQVVSDDALQKLAQALGVEEGNEGAGPSPTLIWRQGRTAHLDVPNGAFARWKAMDGQKSIASGEGHSLVLPADVPLGIFQLLFELGESETRRSTLIVAPDQAYQLDDAGADRIWVLAVQLYAVRSRRNWGHGDFTDLANLVRLAAEAGAAGIGLNPLHALFDDRPEHASPYSPNSRLFLNPLYIALDAVPEFRPQDVAGLEDALKGPRDAELVDYSTVAALKVQALRSAYQRFRKSRSAKRRADFKTFRLERGEALTRFAAFEVLRRRFQSVWWEWPAEWRQPTVEAIDRVRADAGDEIGYHEYVQWLADRQLAACQAEARRLGMPVGLYIDLAVGVEPGGADAWSAQDSVVQQVEVGAPPDLLNTAGQAWGLAALNPRALETQAFAPFAELLAAAMRHAGAIRLDHVLGLNRLFLIPFGMTAKDGAYVRYPLQALLAVVALESVRHRCLVIGEDLGTVPEELRGILADWGIGSYLVMLFERSDHAAFKLPHDYKQNALVTFSTHDLPTFEGWRTNHDLRVKWGVGLDPGETEDGRHHSHHSLREALQHSGLGWHEELEFLNIARFLARTPSRLMVVQIEDVLRIADQPNIPGTLDEHPNWRRRLPVDLEDFGTDERLRTLAAVLAQEGRTSRGPHREHHTHQDGG
jgi:4-alpha-glucanotransferase